MPSKPIELKFNPAQRKRNGEYRTCQQCGKTFYLTVTRAKRNETFCSVACRCKFGRVDKTCPVCGKTYSVTVSTQERYTVCSDECRRAKRDSDGRLTYSKSVKPCKRCGKLFQVSERQRARTHCSEACYRPPTMCKCSTCGKEFRQIPSQTNRQFCSFACYRRSQSETSIERTVRLALDHTGIAYTQEARIGRYSIDFFLSLYGVAIEVDGDYWHRDAKRDARKNAYLQGYNIHTIRIKESEIRACNISALLRDRLAAYIAESDLPQVTLFDLSRF